MILTRRSAIAAAVGVGVGASVVRSAPKATAFGLIGDRYHNSDYIRVGLNKTIATDLGVSIDFTDETRALTADTLAGYRLLIVFRDGMIWPEGYPDESTNAAWVSTRPKLVSDPPVPPPGKSQFWMKPAQGKAVRQFVENGGAALFLHNATHIGLTDPDFRHVLGAAYAGHPAVRTYHVKVKNPDHPITQGIRDFTVTDEQHYMQYDKDPKDILVETVNADGLPYRNLGASAPGAWAYDYGKGRVCYLSPGHLLTVLWNPEYVKLQQSAVRWLLRSSLRNPARV